MMDIDRDIVHDGDVLRIKAYEHNDEITFTLGLSHRANGLQILLTASELREMISKAEEGLLKK